MIDVPVSTSPSRDLMRVRPVDPFRWLRSEVDRIFEDFDEPRRVFSWGSRTVDFPPIDMRDEKDAFVITADVAGYGKDQISIEMEDGSLVLKGQRAEQSERKEGGYLINERRQGEFERRIPMPRHADHAKVKATLEKGLLRIELPKVPDPEARRVEIQQVG